MTNLKHILKNVINIKKIQKIMNELTENSNLLISKLNINYCNFLKKIFSDNKNCI